MVTPGASLGLVSMVTAEPLRSRLAGTAGAALALGPPASLLSGVPPPPGALGGLGGILGIPKDPGGSRGIPGGPGGARGSQNRDAADGEGAAGPRVQPAGVPRGARGDAEGAGGRAAAGACGAAATPLPRQGPGRRAPPVGLRHRTLGSPQPRPEASRGWGRGAGWGRGRGRPRPPGGFGGAPPSPPRCLRPCPGPDFGETFRQPRGSASAAAAPEGLRARPAGAQPR